MCADHLYTIDEAAAILNIPAATLRKKVSADLVPHRRVFKHVRFSASDLAAIPDLRPGPKRSAGITRA